MDKIIVGIASIKSREKSLEQTIKSLQEQSIKADEIILYLNDYWKVPNFIKGKNITALLGKNNAGDLGDAGKFISVGEEKCLYFGCDDDIIYPYNYLETMKSGVKQHKCIVSLHGSILKFPVTNFYRDRHLINFKKTLANPTKVHVGGSGVMAFSTNHFELDINKFLKPNMADLWVAVQAQIQKVGIVVLPHKKNWVKPIKGTTTNSIFQRFVRDEKKIKEMADTINSIEKWQIH